MPMLRIAVIGAECTGKTTLCRELTLGQGGLWVPEYLREFVDAAGRPPLAHEQAALMAEQVAREDAALRAAETARHAIVAFDSVPLATALYSRLYFDDDSLLAAATTHHGRYDLTLVTDIDLPWEADGLQRDGPDIRARFHDLLLGWLDAQALQYTPIHGSGQARLRRAVAALLDVTEAKRPAR